MTFPTIVSDSKAAADDYLREIYENYGHIGEAFVHFVVQNYAKVKQAVIECQRRIDRAVNARPAERFQTAAMAVAIVAGAIANEQGWLPYDMIALENHMLTIEMPASRHTITEEYAGLEPVNTLMYFLEQNAGHIVRVTHKNAAGYSNVPMPAHGELVAHYDVPEKEIWVVKNAFRDFCVKRSINALTTMRTLQHMKVIGATDIKRVIGANTDYAKGRSMVFIINMAHPAVADHEVTASPTLSGNVVPIRTV